MRVLVCGGRDFHDDFEVGRVLLDVHSRTPITLLIHGGATGADQAADRWARGNNIPCAVYKANWPAHGRAAGPIRNQLMLDESKPKLVVAFPGGAGTADMVRRARAASVEVVEVSVAHPVRKAHPPSKR